MRNVRLLLLESDASLREILVDLLEERGIRVEAVATAVEAARSIRKARPHVMVSDLYPPWASVRALPLSLRRTGAGRPIPRVLLSAGPIDRPYEADAVVGKPFELDVLLGAIEKVAAANQPPRS